MIKQQIVSDNVISKRSYGRTNQKKVIVIHETDNPHKGAGAQAHANLQSNLNPREASWHYQVDDKQIIKSFPHNVSCWAGGDGRGGKCNMNGIHIEICVNSGSDYKQAVINASKLVKKLMSEHKLGINDVIQHNACSGKHCPRNLREGSKGIDWAGFKALLSSKIEQVSKPINKPVKQTAKPVVKPVTNKITTVTGSIANVQRRANTYSFNNIAVDNIAGVLTHIAIVKMYQHELNVQYARGLVIDGIAGKQTIGASVTIRNGATGNITYAIQALLLIKGYMINPDGVFGKDTERVVCEYQRSVGLEADGMVGKLTISRLTSR